MKLAYQERGLPETAHKSLAHLVAQLKLLVEQVLVPAPSDGWPTASLSPSLTHLSSTPNSDLSVILMNCC